MTFADLISQAESHILSGERDELNQLANTINASETDLTFSHATGGIQSGGYLAIDLEVMYVWSLTSDTATVQRGMLGSTPASHTSGAIVYVNPVVSKWDISKAVNAEIVALSGEGLFAVKSFTLTSDAVRLTYAVPEENTDILDLLEVRWSDVDAEQSWPKIDRRGLQISRDLPTDDFASGIAIRMDESFLPGRPIRVRYSAPFTALSALTDDPIVDGGLADTMLDIPPLGAAARLMGVKESKRALSERATDPRRAQEVPPGSARGAMATLLALRDARILTEKTRLRQRWPA